MGSGDDVGNTALGCCEGIDQSHKRKDEHRAIERLDRTGLQPTVLPEKATTQQLLALCSASPVHILSPRALADGYLFVLLTNEDGSLLDGSIGLFVFLAAIMFVT